MSSPRLLLGFVKQLIQSLINSIKTEIRNSNPVNSLHAIANTLNVAEDDYKSLLQKISNISKNVTRKVVNLNDS